MRFSTTASILALTLLTTTTSFAAGRPKTKKPAPAKVEPVTVAAAPALPPLPAPEPVVSAPPVVTSTPAPKDQPAKPAPLNEEPAGAGFVLVFGSGGGYLGGQMAKGLDISAGLVTFDLKLGAYITRHFGIMAGVQGGYGALFDGCAGPCTKAFHYQLPVVAQYAFADRRHGAYVEGGLAILTTYGAGTDSKENPGASPETLTVSAPFDLKLGVGYRISMGPKTEKASTSALDLRFGADLGQFTKVEYHSVPGDVVGEIAGEKQAMHFNFGLSVGYHFAP